MADLYTTRKTCRSCGCPSLRTILSLGNLFVSGFVDSPEDWDRCVRAPLELVLCAECQLLQLRHTVNPDLLYRQYWYRSMINSAMRAALADVAASAESLAALKDGDVVLDIGCNDGTLLRSYRTPGLARMGFEPAGNLLADAGQGTTRIFNDFFRADPFLEASPRKSKVITTIAMFYDLEDPNRFVSDVKQCLDLEGIWIIQMSYLPTMLENNAFDNVCHEHLEFYSLRSLENLLARHDLEIFDVLLNDVNGGSFRVYIRHSGSVICGKEGLPRVQALEEYERGLHLENLRPYEAFASRVEKIKEEVCGFIRQEAAKGKRIYAYGASTKGNTTLQYFGLDRSLIPAAVERSPDKWGKLTVGTWIPIISEEQMRKERPDFLLVLPWHFLKEFLKREETYLESGGEFVVPLPHFRVQ